MIEKVGCLIALVLVIIGSLNWGLHAFGLNAVDRLDSVLSDYLGKGNLSKFIYLLVAVSGVLVAVQTARKKIKACSDDDDD